MNVLSCHLIIAIQRIQIVFGCIIPDKTSQTAQQRILDAVRSLRHVLIEEVQNGLDGHGLVQQLAIFCLELGILECFHALIVRRDVVAEAGLDDQAVRCRLRLQRVLCRLLAVVLADFQQQLSPSSCRMRASGKSFCILVSAS